MLKIIVVGTLKGYDQLLNLVLDEVEETIQGMLLPISISFFFFNISFLILDIEPEPRTRHIGLAVLRGPTITIISPVDGSAEIDNPFVAPE